MAGRIMLIAGGLAGLDGASHDRVAILQVNDDDFRIRSFVCFLPHADVICVKLVSLLVCQ